MEGILQGRWRRAGESAVCAGGRGAVRETSCVPPTAAGTWAAWVERTGLWGCAEGGRRNSPRVRFSHRKVARTCLCGTAASQCEDGSPACTPFCVAISPGPPSICNSRCQCAVFTSHVLLFLLSGPPPVGCEASVRVPWTGRPRCEQGQSRPTALSGLFSEPLSALPPPPWTCLLK